MTETQQMTLQQELVHAEAELAEAARVHRLENQRLEELSNQLAAVRRAGPSLMESGASLNGRIGQAEHTVEGQRKKVRAAQQPLTEKQSALAAVHRRIAEHPLYSAAIDRQREIVKDAADLSEQAWVAPLDKIKICVAAVLKVADLEQQFIAAKNAELRAAGLPELRFRLRGTAFTILPMPILEMDIATLASDAAARRRELTAF